MNIYTVPPDYLGTVSLQFAFPSATQFPGGANLIVKDSRSQAVTTYQMAYMQNAPVAGGFHPGYAYAVPLGKHGDHVQLSLDVTVEAINADCSYHSFSTHWQNANGVL